MVAFFWMVVIRSYLLVVPHMVSTQRLLVQ
jgi:hypothetical protein